MPEASTTKPGTSDLTCGCGVQLLQVAAMSLLVHTVFSAAQEGDQASETLASGIAALCARFEPMDVSMALKHLVARGVLLDPQSARPFGPSSAWRAKLQVLRTLQSGRRFPPPTRVWTDLLGRWGYCCRGPKA